jgi:hypothetical protein
MAKVKTLCRQSTNLPLWRPHHTPCLLAEGGFSMGQARGGLMIFLKRDALPGPCICWSLSGTILT